MRRVLHQRVLEAVDRVGRRAALEDQLGSDELAESRLQLVLGKAGDRAQQRVGKLASDRRADLRHPPRRHEAVEPRQQRGVQGCRDRERLQRAIEHVAIVLLAQQTSLQDALGQFLDKQRHAVGAVGNLEDDLVGQRLAAGDLRYQSGAVTPVQTVESQHADLRLAGPRRLELWAERHDQQHRQAADMLDGEVEQLPRGGVEPMRILPYRDHRLFVRQTLELADQRLQRPFLFPLRTEIWQRVALRSRQ